MARAVDPCSQGANVFLCVSTGSTAADSQMNQIWRGLSTLSTEPNRMGRDVGQNSMPVYDLTLTHTEVPGRNKGESPRFFELARDACGKTIHPIDIDSDNVAVVAKENELGNHVFKRVGVLHVKRRGRDGGVHD